LTQRSIAGFDKFAIREYKNILIFFAQAL